MKKATSPHFHASLPCHKYITHLNSNTKTLVLIQSPQTNKFAFLLLLFKTVFKINPLKPRMVSCMLEDRQLLKTYLQI